MGFSKRLKELREKKGLSQEQLAEILNIPRTSITHYENSDDRLPRMKRLQEIADFFNVDIQFLLDGTNKYDEIDYSYDLEELLRDKKLTWGNEVLTEEEKKKAIEILNILLDGKRGTR